ncbi:MAG: HNH endonuclease [Myxococcales bacterium]
MGAKHLLAATHDLASRARVLEADLVEHLAEIDTRELYLERAFPSMFAFCLGELGFSGDVAFNRIVVARLGRKLPAVIDALRSGRVHLTGLRLLARHLTQENHREVLADAAGKSRREIEELVARLAPRPPAADLIRHVPDPPATQEAGASLVWQDREAAVITPLSSGTFKVQFTASRALRDKLLEARDLLSHRGRKGLFAEVMEKALDLLIEKVKKERFAIVRKPRKKPEDVKGRATSRALPAAIKRAAYKRDQGRCTFTDKNGRRCTETSGLQFHHADGFARTRKHELERVRLLCTGHHKLADEKLYGQEFMERARMVRDVHSSTRPGTGSFPALV